MFEIDLSQDAFACKVKTSLPGNFAKSYQILCRSASARCSQFCVTDTNSDTNLLLSPLLSLPLTHTAKLEGKEASYHRFRISIVRGTTDPDD